MKRTSLFAASLFLFALIPCLNAAEITVGLRLDRKVSNPTDVIRMVVKVSGIKKNDSEPVIKGLNHFTLNRGGTSSRLEILNGRIASSIEYTYFIQPAQTGVFQIGPAEVTIKGKIFRSNRAKLEIVKSGQSSRVDQEPVFLSAAISSPEIFVEEQVIYTLKLYRSIKVRDVSLNLPDMQHISFKQLGKPFEYQSTHNGESHQVLEVRYALIASRQGNYDIDPSRMSMTAFQARKKSYGGLFDDPFSNDPFFSFSRGKSISVSSNPLKLKVIPLPEEGMPDGFSGLVGTFQIDSRVEPAEIKTGESATLTVFLRGRGNVSRIPDLKIPALDHIKVYADEPVLKVGSDSNGVTALKTMKWALVPEKEGKYRIPPLSVSFFDTEAHKYRTIKTSVLSLSILPDENDHTQTLLKQDGGKVRKNTDKQAVEELGHDILPVNTSIKNLSKPPLFQVGGLMSGIILVIPFLLYTFTLVVLRFVKKSDEFLANLNAKKAAKNFIRKYRKGGFGPNDLILYIRDYLNHRFGFSLGSLTPDEAVNILQSKGVSHDSTKKLHTILRSIEDAVYMGKGDDSCDKVAELPDLIRQIEKEIR